MTSGLILPRESPTQRVGISDTNRRKFLKIRGRAKAKMQNGAGERKKGMTRI